MLKLKNESGLDKRLTQSTESGNQGYHGEATHRVSPHNKVMIRKFCPLKKITRCKEGATQSSHGTSPGKQRELDYGGSQHRHYGLLTST